MPEPYQKVCRISYDGRLLASGGDDGILRVWTFPDLNPVHKIEGHTKEIDDLEFRFGIFIEIHIGVAWKYSTEFKLNLSF